MSRSTSFTLDQELEAFLDEQLASGRYRSSSEVVREALRRMAEDQRKHQALYLALDEGDASPDAPDGVWDRLDARVRKRSAR
jgi:antitoxin ParD1/3/4